MDRRTNRFLGVLFLKGQPTRHHRLLKFARHLIRGNQWGTTSSRRFRPPIGFQGLRCDISMTDNCRTEKFTERMIRNDLQRLC